MVGLCSTSRGPREPLREVTGWGHRPTEGLEREHVETCSSPHHTLHRHMFASTTRAKTLWFKLVLKTYLIFI